MKEPIFSSYTSYGCLLSIMDDDLWPWIFNNFIQIRYAHGWRMYSFDSHHILLQNCPGIDFYIVPEEIFKLKWNSLKQCIIETIDMGYYLFIYINRYYIHQTSSYKKENVYHELMIFGYDLEKEEVFIADNLKNGKFIKSYCSFSNLEMGYNSIESDYKFMTDVRFIKPSKRTICEINIKQIISSMESYLYSRKTFDLLVEQEFDFGFTAVSRLFNDIIKAEEIKSELDIRGFHLLYEHKLLMELRLGYMITNSLINKKDSQLLEEIKMLTKSYLILRNLVLKYNIDLNIKTLISIRTELEANIQKEKLTILKFINFLKKM